MTDVHYPAALRALSLIRAQHHRDRAAVDDIIAQAEADGMLGTVTFHAASFAAQLMAAHTPHRGCSVDKFIDLAQLAVMVHEKQARS
ncbi:hypothetical protein [Nocardiopsis rhodophaea]|uniref:hypothetical protein n=1 Tax=Nocardiopsis rhodophaea TaxID=280238 RepID=UPI0031DE4A55